MVTVKRHQRFAKIALELAGETKHSMTHSLVALVVSKNKVLSIGYNQPKTHPISVDTPMQMLHAELDAIVRCADDDSDGAEIVVARLKSSGRPGLAKPCAACQKVLRRFGIRRVLYTTNSEDSSCPELKELKL